MEYNFNKSVEYDTKNTTENILESTLLKERNLDIAYSYNVNLEKSFFEKGSSHLSSRHELNTFGMAQMNID